MERNINIYAKQIYFVITILHGTILNLIVITLGIWVTSSWYNNLQTWNKHFKREKRQIWVCASIAWLSVVYTLILRGRNTNWQAKQWS